MDVLSVSLAALTGEVGVLLTGVSSPIEFFCDTRSDWHLVVGKNLRGKPEGPNEDRLAKALPLHPPWHCDHEQGSFKPSGAPAKPEKRA